MTMKDDFSFSIKRVCFDEDYRPSDNTRITTNFANLARGEYRKANLRNALAMIDNRFNALASWDNPAGNRLIAQAGKLAIDTSRISLLGVSAGGCHAVNLALRCADNKMIGLAGMALLYPMLDDKTGSTVMPLAHQGRYLWTAEQNHYGWRTFLGKAPGSDKIPSHHVPARAKTLSGLPPTYIAVGELDLFYAENCFFAERLKALGIVTELFTVPGAFHAFESIAPQSQLADEFNQRLLQALDRFCH